ncbi:MAG: MerR family transcriptional regulator [bacterium]|nr:MerR family transcriptional regulator [bacterium]
MVRKKEKKLYKIGYLTKLLGVTPRTIRYYDQLGLLPHMKRSEGKVRLFDEKDVEIIKKIRRMQKIEYLPLDVIKERLFGKKKKAIESDIVVVTDSEASVSEELKDKYGIVLIPYNKVSEDQQLSDVKSGSVDKIRLIEAPSEKEIVNIYKKLHTKGYKKIYSIHSANGVVNFWDNVVKAAAMVSSIVEVKPVDSRSPGAGLGVLVRQVAEAVSNNSSIEEVDLLLIKQIPMIYNLIYIKSLKDFLRRDNCNDVTETSFQGRLISKLVDFSPVMVMRDGSGEIDIMEFCRKDQDITDRFINCVKEEIDVRGGYIKSIMVVYTYLYGEARDIVNRLKKIYPNTNIYMEEGSSALLSRCCSEMIYLAVA